MTKILSKGSWSKLIKNHEDNFGKNRSWLAIVTSSWAIATLLLAGILASVAGNDVDNFSTYYLVIMCLIWMLAYNSGLKVLQHNFGYLRTFCLHPHYPYSHLENFKKSFLISLGIGSIAVIVNIWLGGIVCFFLFGRVKRKFTVQLAEEYVEGTRLTSAAKINKRYTSEVQRTPSASFWFGGVSMPSRELFTHAKIIGSSGSGKTQFLRLYMRSTLAAMGSRFCDDRAILFDPKSEFAPFLSGLGIPQENIIILNPFDNRGRAWDIAADMTRRRDAATLANILIPEKKEGSSGSGEFFDKAARRIFSGLAKFFITTAKGKWTLRDLILGAQSVELVGLLASKDKKLKRDLQVLGAGDTAGNVIATIAAVIGDELETVAAYMDYHQQQGRCFTLKDWFKSSNVLLLGCDRESEATLQPYNQLLVTRFCELATSSEHLGITHAIFDEVPALGKVGKKLDELARLGRSYHVPLVIAFQAYSSLKELYGENIANALIGQCDKSAYLRVIDHQTAEWASKQIGQTKIRRFLTSTSSGTSTSPHSLGGTSVTTSVSQSEHYETEPAARIEDIMNIQKPNKETGVGIDGFYKVGEHSYRHYIPSSYLRQYGVVDNPLFPGYEEVADLEEAEELRLWEEEDLERLGIKSWFEGLEEQQLETMPISDMAAICLETIPDEVYENLEVSLKA